MSDEWPEANRKGCGAIILCGGQSRRMGSPKAWLPFGPELLLQRVARRAEAWASAIVVVRSPAQAIPELPPHVLVVCDQITGRGPLQGLAAGLSALPGGVELAYATSVDAPFVHALWPRRLTERIGDSDLAIPFVAGRYQPLAALYRRTQVLPRVETLLREGSFEVHRLVDPSDDIILIERDFDDFDPGFATLQNLNTPGEYRAALRAAAFGPMPESYKPATQLRKEVDPERSRWRGDQAGREAHTPDHVAWEEAE